MTDLALTNVKISITEDLRTVDVLTVEAEKSLDEKSSNHFGLENLPQIKLSGRTQETVLMQVYSSFRCT